MASTIVTVIDHAITGFRGYSRLHTLCATKLYAYSGIPTPGAVVVS